MKGVDRTYKYKNTISDTEENSVVDFVDYFWVMVSGMHGDEYNNRKNTQHALGITLT